MKKAPIASRVRKKCPFFPEDTALHQGSLLGKRRAGWTSVPTHISARCPCSAKLLTEPCVWRPLGSEVKGVARADFRLWFALQWAVGPL